MTPSPRQTLKRENTSISRGCLMWGEEFDLLADWLVQTKISLDFRPICPCGSLIRLGGVGTASGAAN